MNEKNKLWRQLTKETMQAGHDSIMGVVRRLCDLLEEQQAKIERLEKAAMRNEGEESLEEWRAYEDGVWALHEVDYAALELRMMASMTQYGRCTASTPDTQSIPRDAQNHPLCKHCGDRFPHLFANGGCVYCSNECEAAATGMIMKSPPPFQSPTSAAVTKPVGICTVCGEVNEYQDGPFVCSRHKL